MKLLVSCWLFVGANRKCPPSRQVKNVRLAQTGPCGEGIGLSPQLGRIKERLLCEIVAATCGLYAQARSKIRGFKTLWEHARTLLQALLHKSSIPPIVSSLYQRCCINDLR